MPDHLEQDDKQLEIKYVEEILCMYNIVKPIPHEKNLRKRLFPLLDAWPGAHCRSKDNGTICSHQVHSPFCPL